MSELFRNAARFNKLGRLAETNGSGVSPTRFATHAELEEFSVTVNKVLLELMKQKPKVEKHFPGKMQLFDSTGTDVVDRMKFKETPTPTPDAAVTQFFTANKYKPGTLLVYRNGERLLKSTITEDGDQSFTLSVAPDANEPLEVDYIAL